MLREKSVLRADERKKSVLIFMCIGRRELQLPPLYSFEGEIREGWLDGFTS